MILAMSIGQRWVASSKQKDYLLWILIPDCIFGIFQVENFLMLWIINNNSLFILIL